MSIIYFGVEMTMNGSRCSVGYIRLDLIHLDGDD
jgi:hypothetical protein